VPPREDRFIEVVGVLDKELVDVLAAGVCGVALGDRIVAVLVWVDIRRGAGEKDAVAGVNNVCGLAGGSIERNAYRLATGASDGFGVLGPGALVVLEIGAGGDGDCDARLHGYHHDTANRYS
jgi:hypothetical protein